MIKPQMRNVVVFLGVLAMGFVGGVAGSRLLSPVHAVAAAAPEKDGEKLTVRELTIVDDQGRQRIFLGSGMGLVYTIDW